MSSKFGPVYYASFDGNVAGPVVNAEFGGMVARTGVGTYTVTLPAPGMPTADFVAHVSASTLGAPALRAATITHTSDLVKTINVWADAFPPPLTDDFRLNVSFLIGTLG